MTPAKRLLRSAFKALLGLYFREIEEVGDRPPAATTGRVFVANHSNALIDPILVLTHAPCDMSPLGKSTLWKIPGLRYLLDLAGAVPVQRRRDDPTKPAAANDEMFAKVAEHLARGGNILVFPEGTSHNEPRLIRLRTGAARMLERARALGATDLSFQAVGLEFDARSKFRSRAVVAYGPVRELGALDAAGGDLVEATTERMRQDLVDMVVEGASWDERQLVMRVAELLRNERGDVSFAEAVRIAQDVERGRDDLRAKDPTLAEEVETRVRAYFTALEALRLHDDQLAARMPPSPGAGATLLGWLALPLYPIGVALYFVPYQLPRLVASRTDEIDQHSTLKLATGLVAYPVWALGLVAAAFAIAPSGAVACAATGVILTSPFAALYWHERVRDIRRTLRLARERGAFDELLEKRARALAAIAAARRAMA